MINEFREALKNKTITDIYSVGFVDDEDGISVFHENLNYLYIEMESRYIKLQSINQYSALKIQMVDRIDYDYEIDEDWKKAKTSIANVVLNDSMSLGNKISKLILYNLNDKELTCDAAEFVLENGQILFLDPSYLFGINIGGIEQKKVWEDNCKEYDGAGVVEVNFSDEIASSSEDVFNVDENVINEFCDMVYGDGGLLISLRVRNILDEVIYNKVKQYVISFVEEWKEQNTVQKKVFLALSDLIDALAGGSRFLSYEEAIKVEDASIEIQGIIHELDRNCLY